MTPPISLPDPLPSFRELILRAEAARREAEDLIRECRQLVAASLVIRGQLPPEDRCRWPRPH
jgi:hypothetical protein